VIRPPAPGELERLREIEVAAGEAFRTVGLGDIADHDPATTAELEAYRLGGHAWVVEEDGAVAGYAVTSVVDGNLHIDQVSVDPAYAGRRLGAGLIDHLDTVAARSGCPALTLTTFTSVPWNGPYYERIGFRTLAEADLGPELAAVRLHEAMLGLDPAERVCMRRDVTQP
jgi:GNAT superfamily N-acetyltransferase